MNTTTTNMKIKPKDPITNESDSAQTVFSIDDLLIALFLYLPIKTLIQLKLVSKQWHRVITNPGFSIHRNPNPNPNPAAGLFLQCLHYVARLRIEYIPFTRLESTKPQLRKLKFVKDPSGIKILHSCNGLLLCSSFKTSHHNRKYYVYNPTTNKFVLLPKPELGGEICGMSLAFDPINSPHYKVISITDHNQCQLKIYSSETGSWRNHGQPPQVGVDFENGVYWNGAIHWTSNENRNDSLYFNVDNQLFGTMPIPPAGWRCVNNYYFGESCGHLHYIKVMEPSLQFKVYEMRRDYSGWFVKYEVNLLPLLKAYPSIKRHGVGPTSSSRFAFSILCLVRGEKEEGSFLVVQIPGKAVRYNLVCGTFDVLYEFAGVNSPGRLRYSGVDAFQYVETLCCI